MDENLLKFLNGETNVYEGPLKLTRDKTNNGPQYIRVCLPNLEGITNDELYKFWHNPKTNKKNKETPKHTGGKKPYLMLMIDEIEELRSQGVKNIEELIGYVACLGKYIEWNTGKLIHKRSKKPIQYKDLLNIYGCSNKKLNKMINLMKEHDLLYHTDEGYFISSKYIKKGKSQNK